MKNLAKQVIANGGSITPLIISHLDTNGTGLLNPSIFNDNGKLILNDYFQVEIFFFILKI